MTKLLSKNNGRKLAGLLAILMMAGMECGAATHYIVPPGTAGATPADPYTNWATAGTNIIDVVNAAMTNTAPRVVWVTNGTYYPTNGMTATVALAIQSVNGRDLTTINGSQHGSGRFISGLQGITITFDGFTVTNFRGNPGNGSILGSDSDASIVKNCSFVNNTNTANAGVVAGRFIVTNCIFRNNNCWCDGALYLGGSGYTVQGCLFEGNQGLYIGACDFRGLNARILDCVFLNNRATDSSRGAMALIYTSGAIVSNCTFIGNSAVTECGALYVGYTGGAIIRNCLFASNSAGTVGGAIMISETNFIENCTIVSNYAGVAGGGLYVTNSDVAIGTNNIIYHNTAPSAPNYTNAMIGNSGLYYTCVYPEVAGTGNITNDPNLVNLGGGNYRLAANSPCINAGMNQSWMTGATDLDGRRRQDFFSHRVDMGCYEYIPNGTVFRIP